MNIYEKSVIDYFRPHVEPARTIYDAFQEESKRRARRDVSDWVIAERHAVQIAAVEYASKHGLRAPTLEDVSRAEVQALGHVDYGAKWAYGVAQTMTPL